MKDVQEFIVPGVTHWQHPSFFAYFPANMSYPSLLGDMMGAMFNIIGFSWITSPACTELETIVLEWLRKALQLPESFSSVGKGGGVIQQTASEATLVALLAAKSRFIKEGSKLEELSFYMSDQSHSSVQKACMIAGIDSKNIRMIESNEMFQLCPKKLQETIENDLKDNLKPCFLVATIGTTSSCAVDDVKTIGQICQKYNIWMHIDSAYAGSAMICPELRHHLDGVEYAYSFNFNPHKWMLTNFDCSTMWIQDRSLLINAFDISPEYLRNKASESGLVIDYRNWQIPLGRRFRSLKLWFVLRTYGIEGIQEYIRYHLKLAELFENLLLKDKRFEITNKREFSLICFRLKDSSNEINKQLLENINKTGKMYIVHTELRKKYILRMAIGGVFTQESHVREAWDLISQEADKLLNKKN